MWQSCAKGGAKVVAIWARGSARGQEELSLDGQVTQVGPWLEGQGYVVPDMERLLGRVCVV